MGNKEKVHELVCGYISEAEDHTVAGVEVQDEKRICDKLGVEEDKDLEFLINLMDDITKNVSMKMYEYGVLIGADEFQINKSEMNNKS